MQTADPDEVMDDFGLHFQSEPPWEDLTLAVTTPVSVGYCSDPIKSISQWMLLWMYISLSPSHILSLSSLSFTV